jgi:hypothetical protein
MKHITTPYLKICLDSLNKDLGLSPLESLYFRKSYGKIGLYERVGEGEKKLLGLSTKREMYNELQALRQGLLLAIKHF